MRIKRVLLLALVALVVTVAHAGREHDAGEAHDHDHPHEAGSGHAGEGLAHDLGHVGLGSVMFAVTTAGEVRPAGEAVVSIVAEQGRPPAELRAWIGVRNGRGSVKSLLKADEHGHYHGHLEVPESLPRGVALWLEVVTDAGRQRGEVALPTVDHDHAAAGEAHEHGHPDTEHRAAGPDAESGHRH